MFTSSQFEVEQNIFNLNCKITEFIAETVVSGWQKVNLSINIKVVHFKCAEELISELELFVFQFGIFMFITNLIVFYN